MPVFRRSSPKDLNNCIQIYFWLGYTIGCVNRLYCLCFDKQPVSVEHPAFHLREYLLMEYLHVRNMHITETGDWDIDFRFFVQYNWPK